jgi:MinD superfamily P-loop ATPase
MTDAAQGVRELTVISGKGGTGKTSIAASLAVLAERPVIADCDVDAADLHLVLSPQVKERHEFRSGHEAVIRGKDCIGCGLCLTHCRFDAVKMDDLSFRGVCDEESRLSPTGARFLTTFGMTDTACQKVPSETTFSIDPISCEGCGVCVRFCPVQAIDFPERLCGEWMVSETRCGPMVHARLGVAAENSGKLVSTVRREARRIAEQEHHSLVIIDGPPGIGCPVIASVTGASLVLVVTEPTVSGEHDLERVLSLARHFSIPSAVCVNKWDINPGMTERIENRARESGARVAGRVRYDRAVTSAQLQELAVVETASPAAADIRHIWDELKLQE